MQGTALSGGQARQAMTRPVRAQATGCESEACVKGGMALSGGMAGNTAVGNTVGGTVIRALCPAIGFCWFGWVVGCESREHE